LYKFEDKLGAIGILDDVRLIIESIHDAKKQLPRDQLKEAIARDFKLELLSE